MDIFNIKAASRILTAIIILMTCFIKPSFSEQQLLKPNDVNKVVQQMLTYHVEKREMTPDLLKQSILIYIDQFDPQRNYLLNNEVESFINLSDTNLNKLVEDYKNGDFSLYAELNQIFQDSIKRSRLIRDELIKEIENEKSELNLTSNSKEDDQIWSDPEIDLKFPSSESELKSRIKDQLITYLKGQKQYYSEDIVKQKSEEILTLYSKKLSALENKFLFINDNNEAMNADEQQDMILLYVLKAISRSLDPHTSFFTSNEAKRLQVHLDKKLHGIGVVLQEALDGVLISKLVPGGPAEKSGLIKPNDQLIEMDGKKINGLSMNRIVEMLQGAEGSKVTLVVQRKEENAGKVAEKQYTVVLQRLPITINEDRVETSFERYGDGIVGKIILHGFYQGDDGISSEKDVRDAIQKLKKEGQIKGLILDLRDNGGGYLVQAVKVAGLFIKSGVVVISKYNTGELKYYRDTDGQVEYDGPLVILTSKATASAAEIVAQTLQDYGVAIIVGDPHTYGKGSIQTQMSDPEVAGGSTFKVTIGKYYTVSGKTPQNIGVIADIPIPGPYWNSHLGEKFLRNSLSNDSAPSAFEDSIQDVDSQSKPWFLQHYLPTLQKKTSFWTNMLPELKQNSALRLTKSGSNAKDKQLTEAVNILKDMILVIGGKSNFLKVSSLNGVPWSPENPTPHFHSHTAHSNIASN